MIKTRDEFIECYMPVIERTVDLFLAKRGHLDSLRDDMISEGAMRLVAAADKFFNDDLEQEIYVRNYVARAATTACIDVIRDDQTISTPRGNPARNVDMYKESLFLQGKRPNQAHRIELMGKKRNGCKSFRVLSPYKLVDLGRDMSEVPETLFDRIRQKRVIDWDSILPQAEAAIVKTYIDTYAEKGKTVTATDLSTRRRLRPKTERILQKLIDDD